ncbi:hypothetical protein PINS_up002305 [Pythium insidiosum]|nr:hypothetical protein PINS_up002305 [Pythium insidiosum]
MMMDSARRKAQGLTERLPCQKMAWAERDLFQGDVLQRHMAALAKRHGIASLGDGTRDVMAAALQEYLKQVVEELVEISKQRGDAPAQPLEQLAKQRRPATAREVTSTDILRVSCEESYERVRREDLALRSQLLEDAKKEELVEKERAKKRKKVDRVKQQAQEEKDEAEMDIEELAVKDLKERLLQEDKDGVVRVDGHVNASIKGRYARQVDHEVTAEDATFWLLSQRPYVPSKLFVRAEAARILTNSLH